MNISSKERLTDLQAFSIQPVSSGSDSSSLKTGAIMDRSI
jgi:hypothetical protein